MYLYQLTEIEVLTFVLVFLRILAFVIAMPVFSMRSVPVQLKVLSALIIGILVHPTVSFSGLSVSALNEGLIFLVVREISVGLVLGFLTRMLFFAVGIMGQLISLAMGLANAQVFNPSMDSQSTTLEQFQTVLVTLFFLAINGHHYFLKGLVESFRLVPVSASFFSNESFLSVVEFANQTIVIGVMLAMPVMVSIFVMNVAMGIIGRAVPQINVLITSLPVNVLLGFLVMIVSMPLFFEEVGGTLEFVTFRLFQFMKIV